MNVRNFCHFWKRKSVFLQILHHSLVSWHNFIYFQQKEPVKIQICWNFTWAVGSLKFCTLMGSFSPNHIFQLKKYRRVISYDSWHRRMMHSLKKNWLVVSNMTWGIWSTQKSENLFSMGSFCPKHTRFELQKYRGFIFNDTEHWCNIWINPDFVVSTIAWGIGSTFIRELKSLKNCTLMGSFCPKHIMFQLENFRGIMCHDTEGWCKI